jgi:hypothetical protein
MPTSVDAYRFCKGDMQTAQGTMTRIISSRTSVFHEGVQMMNMEIICFLTSNTPGGIITDIEHSTIPTTGQSVLNTHRAIFT